MKESLKKKHAEARREKKRLLRAAMRKVTIRSKGLTYSDFGSVTYVSHIINERKKDPAMRQAIAERLCVDFDEFWNVRKRNRSGKRDKRRMLKRAA